MIIKGIKSLGELSNDWTNDLFETNVYKTLELHLKSLLRTLWGTVTISVISNEAHFHHFYFLLSYF